MQQTRVQFLGLEDPLENERANPFWYFSLENPMNREAWQATVHGVARVGRDLAT